MLVSKTKIKPGLSYPAPELVKRYVEAGFAIVNYLKYEYGEYWILMHIKSKCFLRLVHNEILVPSKWTISIAKSPWTLPSPIKELAQQILTTYTTEQEDQY